jgi:peptidoglycan/xylan/chitin deacetylase (PgdA/CDA1 family)
MGTALVDSVPSLEARRATAARCVALLYHDVVPPGDFSSSGFSGADADAYKFERPEFERHLQAISNRRHGGHIATLDRMVSPTATGDLVLTFDDGGTSAPIIAEMLELRGWRGHFFVPTVFIGTAGFMKAAEIRDLHSRGHVIGSHSCSHPIRMASCSALQLRHEWNESVKVLSDILGVSVNVASVPGGYYSKLVAQEAAAAGIEVLFNSEPTAHLHLVSDILVVGRFSIQRGVSAETAAEIASANWRRMTQQYLFWNAKKVAKHLAGPYYLRLRKWVFKRSA